MRWRSHKFGGTSLADNDAFRRVADIIDSEDGRLIVVVSATAGTTNQLVDLVSRAASADDAIEASVDELVGRHRDLARQLLDDDRLGPSFDTDRKELLDLLAATRLMAAPTPNALAVATGYGEIWSARILTEFLKSRGSSASWLNAREVLLVDTRSLVPVPDWDRSRARMDEWLDGHEDRVIVVTGFIASDSENVPVTLGRNGSDLSASIFGTLLEADEVVIWTDVDGVMTADPKRVPGAHVIDELTYDEAMELAYFGARVIHPHTMGPVVRAGIPIVIRNTRDLSSAGTRIGGDTGRGTPVKGFATIDDLALFNVEGSAMIGVPGISERLFGALRQEGVSVVMISQASSEHSICFAAPSHDIPAVEDALRSVFQMERRFGQIKELEVADDCSILAAVGDAMSGTPGIAARLFTALARVGVNVRAIAQGASERNISVVIDTADSTRALRAAHAAFYLSDQAISIGLIGPGNVGATLLHQIDQRRAALRDRHGVDLRVRAIANSTKMVLNEESVDLETWREDLAAGEDFDVSTFVDHVHTTSVPHAVIVDCTASDEVAKQYLGWLESGIHVITPNKRASSADFDYYSDLITTGRTHRTRFLYETTVGAALPVIQTTRDLINTGDEIHRIEGVLSGTLSYLFNNFDASRGFSELVAEARARGFTEPDPRDDLSGMDVARKVVILAREIGHDLSLQDLDIEGLVPPELEHVDLETFLARMPDYDDVIAQRFRDADSQGQVLRYVGVVDVHGGARVGLEAYPKNHPFAGISGADNIIRFQTGRYDEAPLVVRGPGAGPDLTAGGVFADLLRLAQGLGAV